LLKCVYTKTLPHNLWTREALSYCLIFLGSLFLPPLLLTPSIDLLLTLPYWRKFALYSLNIYTIYTQFAFFSKLQINWSYWLPHYCFTTLKLCFISTFQYKKNPNNL
jgi:hypothetical protein